VVWLWSVDTSSSLDDKWPALEIYLSQKWICHSSGGMMSQSGVGRAQEWWSQKGRHHEKNKI